MDPERTASLMTPAKLAQARPKAPVSPAAWLDQMAADAGHLHVRRLGELCAELAGRNGLSETQPVAVALAALAEALPGLDFGLLRPRGFWARATGKGRTAGAEFAAQFERIEASCRALVAQVQALQERQHEQGTAGERRRVEMEVEVRAIEKILDQGARWLQDMRNQLKAREASAGDAQAIADDTLRCEILVARLKLLRAVSSAAQQAHQQAQDVDARRAGVAQLLQQSVGPKARGWRDRLAALAAVAGDKDSPDQGVEGAMESHRELQLCLRQAIADFGQLSVQEQALAASLAALEAQVQAARS